MLTSLLGREPWAQCGPRQPRAEWLAAVTDQAWGQQC